MANFNNVSMGMPPPNNMNIGIPQQNFPYGNNNSSNFKFLCV